ncbi:MAG: succinylglutamate desuccinylase/aspartoacylase family protein [Bdellovibrionaceae bacterium]|nr:succinylglutamate desuccinylase/aspartoacylase family protein [Pseudobdellovibrionaceae bacterium]
MKLRFDILNELPKDLLNINYQQIKSIFPHPSLIHLEGAKKEPLFISTCLHGNEDVGFKTIQKLKAYLETHNLPRSLSIFIGNVDAAELNLRRKEQQKDYNRIWRKDNSPEGLMAQDIINIMKEKNTFASLDLHNNSGKNPMYACVNSTTSPFLKLASLFANNIVYFDNPNTCQSMAFADFCPSVTIECGQTGNFIGPEKAFEYILDLLHLDSFEVTDHTFENLNLYQTLGRLCVEGTRSISFSNEKLELNFPGELELWNFTPLKAHTLLAYSLHDHQSLYVRDENDKDISEEFIYFKNKHYYLSQDCVPAMLTSDLDVIYKDCLGYLMKTMKHQNS